MTKQRKAGSLLFTLMLCGCQISGAPSLEIVGAFFPAWLLCAVAGIAAAGISRIVQVSFVTATTRTEQGKRLF